MKKEEKLYETLGELLYAVAMADGVIQPEEKEALNKLLKNHSKANGILWSFEYEYTKGSTVDDLYNKAINFCHGYGPSPAYIEFNNAMLAIAEAAEGVSEQESDIIKSFSRDLLKRFKRDTEKLVSYEKE